MLKFKNGKISIKIESSETVSTDIQNFSNMLFCQLLDMGFTPDRAEETIKAAVQNGINSVIGKE